ncbi:hypothetical protein TNCV_3894451 [Trichonephila clavipes]|nr:hypothetical protein TNCV_3894451 [Trichonephila clavipes]
MILLRMSRKQDEATTVTKAFSPGPVVPYLKTSLHGAIRLEPIASEKGGVRSRFGLSRRDTRRRNKLDHLRPGNTPSNSKRPNPI